MIQSVVAQVATMKKVVMKQHVKAITFMGRVTVMVSMVIAILAGGWEAWSYETLSSGQRIAYLVSWISSRQPLGHFQATLPRTVQKHTSWPLVRSSGNLPLWIHHSQDAANHCATSLMQQTQRTDLLCPDQQPRHIQARSSLTQCSRLSSGGDSWTCALQAKAAASWDHSG